MPDTLSQIAVERGLSLAQRVALLRKPLPSHQIKGGNFRQWAAAVCTAEVKHRERDYLRVEAELGIHVDRWDFPNNDEVGQYPHEAHAGAALLWLSHLQAHEDEKRAPWFTWKKWPDWSRHERGVWLSKRRKLWAGFLKEVSAYQNARKEAGL